MDINNTATATKYQIEALRVKAVASGDRALVIVCDHALGSDVVFHGPAKQHEIAAISRALTMTKCQALAECARVIAEGDRS